MFAAVIRAGIAFLTVIFFQKNKQTVISFMRMPFLDKSLGIAAEGFSHQRIVQLFECIGIITVVPAYNQIIISAVQGDVRRSVCFDNIYDNVICHGLRVNRNHTVGGFRIPRESDAVQNTAAGLDSFSLQVCRICYFS